LKVLEEEIRRRIESLRLILAEKSESRSLPRPPARPLPIEDIQGAVQAENRFGRYLAIEKTPGEYSSTENLMGAAAVLLGEGRAARPFIFMDLETTGFSSTPLFLAGTAFVEDGNLRCRQFLARDYSEERSVVGALDELLARYGLCVTFNGKSFDMPYLRERAKYHRLDLRSCPDQYDLLHVARRMWKDRLPNCRLATLERYVLGRARVGDVPGWEVPCIYHDFVHTKDARRIRGVIRHNLVDVLSMVELFISLAEATTC
jgi:uncharacterized protein YprB with RNaseH-like and TPR domain